MTCPPDVYLSSGNTVDPSPGGKQIETNAFLGLDSL